VASASAVAFASAFVGARLAREAFSVFEGPFAGKPELVK
jgi:hypothetical protein